MSESEAKKKLLSFLNARVFRPILGSSPNKYSENERENLEEVEEKTQIERYKNYGSAEELRERYKGDLSSSMAKKVDAKLKRLKLPKLPNVKEEFLELADKLGVHEGGTQRPRTSSGSSYRRTPTKHERSHSRAHRSR